MGLVSALYVVSMCIGWLIHLVHKICFHKIHTNIFYQSDINLDRERFSKRGHHMTLPGNLRGTCKNGISP